MACVQPGRYLPCVPFDFLLTEASRHYAPVNLSNTLTIVDTTFLLSKKEIQRVHAITRNETLKLSQTTQLRSAYHIQSCPSFHYQLSLLSSQDTTASFKPHLLLLSDEPTTLGTFLRTNKQINRYKESFRCDTFSDVIPFLPVGKWEPFIIVVTATLTLKILFTWYIFYVATNCT